MRRTLVIAAAGLTLVGGVLAGCGEEDTGASGEGEKPAAAANGADKPTENLGPKVTGTMTDSVFISGDAEARRNMRITKVFCRWNGDEVEVGATLHNSMATHVTVHIQPNYRLKRAGLHGDGIGSVKDAGVDADATRVWSEKVGNPDNVDGKPAITSCEPELLGVDLG